MPQQCNFCPLLVKTGKIEHLSYFVFGWLGSRVQKLWPWELMCQISNEMSVILYYYSLWSHYRDVCVLSLPQIVRGPVDFRFFLIWQALIINAHCFPFLSKHPVKTVLCGFYSLFIFALDCSPVLYHRVCRCKNKADIISQSNPLICGIHGYNYSQI